jgi:F-type H+-transporting ATPase subunit epsilon
MSKDSIHVVVITPEKQVLDTTTDSLIIPAHDGQLGAWPNRASLMCQLGKGELKYRKGGSFQVISIHGGFAQIHKNNAIILTEKAEVAESAVA